VNFGTWYQLLEAPGAAPAAPGVLQARAERPLPYPRGKSAMVFYGASAAAEDLRGYVTGRGAADLRQAGDAGARFVRFGVTDRPQPELERLLGQFSSRFGAPPIGNTVASPAASRIDHV
jgi:hypothetical protein